MDLFQFHGFVPVPWIKVQVRLLHRSLCKVHLLKVLVCLLHVALHRIVQQLKARHGYKEKVENIH